MNDKTIQELREKVFTAIGEASMCWVPTPQGIFDSTRAENVGRRLVDEILTPAEKEEPLHEIAYKRGWGVRYGWGEISMNGKPHNFTIHFTDKTGYSKLHMITGVTYEAAEKAAREWLEKQEDAK